MQKQAELWCKLILMNSYDTGVEVHIYASCLYSINTYFLILMRVKSPIEIIEQGFLSIK
jgi:hypothetical protein